MRHACKEIRLGENSRAWVWRETRLGENETRL
jgi:hypothetical protein